MIYAQIKKIEKYIDSGTYEKIKGFFDRVNENTPDGEYEIQGKEIFSRIQTYETVTPGKSIIEAHDRYIDIQFTLRGAEGISVFDRGALEESESYDEDKDVVFFREDESKIIAHTNNLPGYFTLLYPEDAHRPKERIRGIDEVKKVVIKVRV